MVKIKLIDKTLDEVNYQTEGSAGIDLYSRIDMEIKPNEHVLIPLNIVVDTPLICMLGLLARSSLFKKKGLMLVNGMGVIDSDYSGEYDEIMASVINMKDEVSIVKKGERICQIVFMDISKPSLEYVNKMKGKTRGGFGSTDNA